MVGGKDLASRGLPRSRMFAVILSHPAAVQVPSTSSVTAVRIAATSPAHFRHSALPPVLAKRLPPWEPPDDAAMAERPELTNLLRDEGVAELVPHLAEHASSANCLDLVATRGRESLFSLRRREALGHHRLHEFDIGDPARGARVLRPGPRHPVNWRRENR